MKNPLLRVLRKVVLKYFLEGLVLIVPVALTIWVIYKVFRLVDSTISPLLPVSIPGLGILVMIILIAIIGFLGSSIIFQPLKKWFIGLLDRAPLIKTIYSAIRDLLSAFVGKKRTFNKPVMVKVSGTADVHKLGFITQEDLSILGIDSSQVAVYLPHSYNFSGNLFIVPASHITPINGKSADVMKFIVSGGVTELEAELDK